MLEYSAATRHLRHDDRRTEPRSTAEIAETSTCSARLCVLCGFFLSSPRAQDEPAAPRTTRLAVLQAEDRRAPTPRDLAIIRSGAARRRRADACASPSARSAVSSGRRSIPDIAPVAAPRAAEIRAEAANAIAQAAQGWKGDEGRRPPRRSTPSVAPLAARLEGRSEPDVRARDLRDARPPAVRHRGAGRSGRADARSRSAARARDDDRSARRRTGLRGARAGAAQAARAGRRSDCAAAPAARSRPRAKR